MVTTEARSFVNTSKPESRGARMVRTFAKSLTGIEAAQRAANQQTIDNRGNVIDQYEHQRTIGAGVNAGIHLIAPALQEATAYLDAGGAVRDRAAVLLLPLALGVEAGRVALVAASVASGGALVPALVGYTAAENVLVAVMRAAREGTKEEVK